MEINFAHVLTAPTRSNSGLQALVAQFASVSGKQPDELTVADVNQYKGAIEKIQEKNSHYGFSTSSLAEAMRENGQFWASIGSVYESSVIESNQDLLDSQSQQQLYVAVYPQNTFTSNMRAILPQAPWVSEAERLAGKEVIEFLRTDDIQSMAIELGLRPGILRKELEEKLRDKFVPSFGVEREAKYNAYKVPEPKVVEEMLEIWRGIAKPRSLAVAVIDSSESTQGKTLAAMQQTLSTYIESLYPQNRLALMKFNSELHEITVIQGNTEGRDKGIEFISNLKSNGGSRLYDTILEARNWLNDNHQTDALNVIFVLSDGEDIGSGLTIDKLNQELGIAWPEGDDYPRNIPIYILDYKADTSSKSDSSEQEESLSPLEKINAHGVHHKAGNESAIIDAMEALWTPDF